MPAIPGVFRYFRARVLIGALLSITALAVAAIMLEAVVRARINDDMFRSPTRFYARPVVLTPGMQANREHIEAHLKRLGYRRTSRRSVRIGEYNLGSGRWAIGRRTFRHHDRVDPGGVTIVDVGYSDRVWSVRDDDGNRLRYVALEPELLRTVSGSSREDRVPVPLSDVPEQLVNAVLTIEDRRFFDHQGLDFRRMVGAAIANVRARRVKEGASTVTQQLVKNAFLSPRRTPIRKLREMAMAILLEQRHSKEEILEAYLNEVYLGQDGALGIHGVGRAAQFYFAKDVTQLNLAESALLAGMMRGPSLYSPIRHEDRAKKRRDLVLTLMHEQEMISDREYSRAKKARLGLRKKPRRKRTGAYFVDHAVRRLANDHGKSALQNGLVVFTTLDARLQRLAERAVSDELKRLERNYPRLKRQDTPLQAALVALDPHTGEILAMVGGRDYGTTQYNRAIHARRQPGSAFKPIVALAALSESDEYTLATLLPDEPLTVETPAGLWQPANYDGQFRGNVTMREAIERSLNVPFARLGMDIGPERVVKTARRLGIEGPLNAFPSIALGSSEVTPLELTRAFGVLAADGTRAETRTMLGALDANGEMLWHDQREGKRVYDAAETYLVTSALLGAVERGTGRSLRQYGFRGEVAAKSGTTNGFRDAWFVGYTPNIAVGVWVGFDNGRSVGLSGSRAALPIFARFLVGAVGSDRSGDFSPPFGIEVVEVDPETGLRAGPGCRGEPEVFIRGTAPEESCSPFWMADRRTGRDHWRWERDARDLVDEVRRYFKRRGN